MVPKSLHQRACTSTLFADIGFVLSISFIQLFSFKFWTLTTLSKCLNFVETFKKKQHYPECVHSVLSLGHVAHQDSSLVKFSSKCLVQWVFASSFPPEVTFQRSFRKDYSSFLQFFLFLSDRDPTMFQWRVWVSF